MSDWYQPAMPCPMCGSLEDLRVRERADGGLDYQCRACCDSGILDVQAQLAGTDRVRTRAQAHAENLAAATQWRELAAKCEEAAAWEESIGCPYGDVSTYHYNAALYRQTAAQLEALYR